MSLEEVRLFFSALDLRERVIGGLAIVAGLRPGEIFALTRGRVERQYADIQQRVYRGEIGTPKTVKSRRWAAFENGLGAWIRRCGPTSWATRWM
jgi:hypothetical protein